MYGLRVYYEDTDAGGVVYHAGYLRFAERARTELLRAGGFDHIALLREQGLAFVVRRVEIDFLRPAFLDDWLEVRTETKAVSGARMVLMQVIEKEGFELVRLEVTLVLVNPDKRPARIPASLRSAFDKNVSS